MITLDNLFTFFEFIAEENTYIQHQPGTTGTTNRFSRFATESTTGQLSKLGYPRLEVVQLPFGLITDFSSSQQETLTARVRVIYKLSDKFDFDEEVTALDNAKKALFQMLNYIQTAQDECPGNSLLCAFDMNSVRYTFLDKATFSGSAVGCELSINFKKGICWEDVAYGDFPEYNGTIALPTTAGSYVLRLLNGVYSWVAAAAGTTWGSISGTLSNQTDLQNALNSKQNSLGYTAENQSNKTDVMSGNTTSSVKYLSAKGVYNWVISLGYITSAALTGYLTSVTAAATYQVILTAANFGAFINSLTGKATPVDADYLTIWDSVSQAAQKLSLSNLYAYLKAKFDLVYTSKIASWEGTATITGTTSLTAFSGASILIPANTFAVGDNVCFDYTSIRNIGGANNIEARVHINTSNTLTGATTVVLYAVGNVHEMPNITRRNMHIKSATETYSVRNLGTDNPQNNTTVTLNTLNINWTVDQYLIPATRLLNSGDTHTLLKFKVYKT